MRWRRSSSRSDAGCRNRERVAWLPDDAISIAELDGDQLVLIADQDQPKLWLHETAELASVEVVWDP